MKHLLIALALLLLVDTSAAADVQPFTPSTAGTKTISCTSSSAATALAFTGQDQLELQNAGTVNIYVEVGISTVTAAVATGYPIMPGQSKVISISQSATHIACIVAATTTTLYVSTGVGL